MSVDDDDSSLQLELEKLISSGDTVSSPDRTGSDLHLQDFTVLESDNLLSFVGTDVDDGSVATSKPVPDLKQCYSWLHQNVSRRDRKISDTDSSSSGTSDSGSSSSSCSSASSLALPMPTPPDGGWGWMVVLGAFMVSFICDGLAYCFGVLYAELLSQFGASKSETSLVGSIFFGVSMILGPFASSMTTRFGCRKVTIFGGLLSSVGFALSYFANSIEMLCFTFSVIVGIGFSFCYITSVVTVAFYFKKRRALATGLAVCGTGVGTLTFAPFMEYLISLYGWRGLFLIMAGISLNLVVCGMLFRPLKLTEAERCEFFLEEFDKIPHGRRHLELKHSLAPSESTEDGSDDESGEEDLRTLSLMNLPTFASGRIRDAPSDLLMEALKNSRNPHLTIQRFMKNTMFRLGSNDFTEKDKNPIQIHSVTAETFTISFNENSDEKSDINKIKYNIAETCVKMDSGVTIDDTSFVPSTFGSNISNVSMNKKDQVALTGAKKQVGKTPDASERHKAVEKIERLDSESSRLNVGRRWAYGIHLPLYRNDIFYRRWLRQNAQTKPCMLGTSCPELTESFDTKSEGNICQRFVKRYVQWIIDLFTDMFDCALFTNGFFSLFVVSNFLYYLWSDVPYMYAADYAMKHGSNPQYASYLISVIGIFNTMGQVIFGIVGDMDINLISLYAIVSVFAGVFVAMVPLVTSVYWQTCIFYGLFGFCISVGYPLTTVLMVNYLGVERLTSAYGLLMLMQGIANLFGPPFAGWVSDVTGKYDSSFYLSGIFYALSGLVMFFIYVPVCSATQINERTEKLHTVIIDEQTTSDVSKSSHV